MQQLSGTRTQAERQLRQQLDSAASATQTFEEERAALQATVAEAVSKCAQAMNEQQMLEREKVELLQALANAEEQINAVRALFIQLVSLSQEIDARTVFQKTLAEQILRVRSELQQTQDQKNELERRSELLMQENERLTVCVSCLHIHSFLFEQILVQAERRSKSPQRSPGVSRLISPGVRASPATASQLQSPAYGAVPVPAAVTPVSTPLQHSALAHTSRASPYSTRNSAMRFDPRMQRLASRFSEISPKDDEPRAKTLEEIADES